MPCALKVKESWGGFHRSGRSFVARFSTPLEQCLSTMPLSSTLSQLYILCAAQILLTPTLLIYQGSVRLNLQTHILIQRRYLFCTINPFTSLKNYLTAFTSYSPQKRVQTLILLSQSSLLESSYTAIILPLCVIYLETMANLPVHYRSA